ncbi:C/D box methylation guide ribonucleoprotein complex aNOP56 subunit [Candidatus Bathyarchaeota archaeon]|nr:C/D box methylation guide ribonucleoprotein complex aNOP56 subunit [Candidatus Bathyarchaeota archaeon]
MMRAIIFETIIGVYALNEEGEILHKALYPRDTKRIAKLIFSQRKGEITEPVSEILDMLKKDEIGEVSSMNSALLDTIIEEGFSVQHLSSIDVAVDLQREIAKYAMDNGFIEDENAFFEFSQEVTTTLAREEVHERLSDRERLLIPTVQLLEELDTTLNNLSGRMREWYGVHFPELGRRVDDHQDYAKIITMFGVRDNITVKTLQEMSLRKRTADQIVEVSKTSMGAPLYDDDRDILRKFAEKNLDLYSFREELSEYIGLLTKEIAPNIAHLAGPTLGAKLIEKAGGLRNMAMMPSSTIQVLGAEKALFRALKSNAKPPKHGLIFQHPYVHNAPRGKRGSHARGLAAKIAIAARADWFSGDFIADDLLEQLK